MFLDLSLFFFVLLGSSVLISSMRKLIPHEIRISAYMDPWGATEPMDWWTIVNRCRTLHHFYVTLANDRDARLQRLRKGAKCQLRTSTLHP